MTVSEDWFSTSSRVFGFSILLSEKILKTALIAYFYTNRIAPGTHRKLGEMRFGMSRDREGFW